MGGVGWKRDQSVTDAETKDDYGIVRKYSGNGVLLGEYLSRSLWGTEHGPSLGGRGYWTMYAADDRVGALLNENFEGATPEWIEWDLKGVVVARAPLTGVHLQSRAFDGKGRLYAQFPRGETPAQTELKRFDTRDGQWISVRSNLPNAMSASLLGADGEELVYRKRGGGNVHLIWAKPD